MRINTLEKYCTCACHREGMSVMHIIPCCDLTYQKYLDKDGDLIKEKLEKLLDKGWFIGEDE